MALEQETIALVRGYLSRRRESLEAALEASAVFSRRYRNAADELEEVEDLLEALP